MNGVHASPRPLLALALAAVLSPAVADTPSVDTSSWKCSLCPFQTGDTGYVSVGGGYVSDDAAKFGEYNGLDKKGGYAIVDADGRWRRADGWYADYDGRRLGLDSRDVRLRVGKEGLFKALVSYDGLPKRTFDTTSTPFQAAGNDRLTLPAGWPGAGISPAQLSASLVPTDIGHLRKNLGLGVEFMAGSQWTLFANYRREQKNGTGIVGGGSFTATAQLPLPIDSTTDSLEAGVRWQGSKAYLRLAYFGSKFDNAAASLTWDNPYYPLAPGATLARRALAPDNELHEVLLNAGASLPLNTSLSLAAAAGSLKQNEAFLPYSINALLAAGAGALPRASLDGKVDLMHYALTLASRPWRTLRLRGTARYDERDDKTALFAPARFVEQDLLLSLGSTALRYDFKRTQLDGEADYEILRNLRVLIGGRYDELKRPEQSSQKTDEGLSYAGVAWKPGHGLDLVAKGGRSHRDANDYLPAPDENPLLRKFNQANRDRDFYSLRASWTPAEKWNLGVEGNYAKDAYRRSALGLTSAADRRFTANATWMPLDALSLYVDGGYQQVKSAQNGVSWAVRHDDRFRTAGAGGRWTGIKNRWDVGLDYTHAGSTGDIATGPPAGAFPALTTRLDSLRLDLGYRYSKSIRLALGYWYEKYRTEDWALAGVDAGTIPTLLALGADPYRYNVNVVWLSLRYDFAPKQAAATD